MLTIKTYEKLHKFVNAFKQKKLNLLIIVSRGGLGKTFIAEDTLIEQAPLIITGHCTPLRLYMEVLERTREEKDFMLVFDDVDALLLNKDVVALLKQLCDTKKVKTIKYLTTSPILKKMPSEFETSCKVIMLMNTLKPEEPNVRALMSRAHLVHFTPPDIEILNYMKNWATDKVILKFIEQYASFSKALNLRVYVRAKELKDSKLNWKQEVINVLKIDQKLFEISNLLQKYETDKERVEEFIKKGFSRMTYFRYKKLFLAKTSKQIKSKYNINKK